LGGFAVPIACDVEIAPMTQREFSAVDYEIWITRKQPNLINHFAPNDFASKPF